MECQGEKYCRFFKFKVDTNQCWLFTDMIDYPRRKFNEEGYILGPEYCEKITLKTSDVRKILKFFQMLKVTDFDPKRV